jgi:SAM-dependent methyltransferase
MLCEARARTLEENVTYLRGDFRDFHLNMFFDVVVCAADSLNYVEAPADLARVFGCVRRHLRPGGLFIFDVLDDAMHRILTKLKTVIRVGSEQFDLYHFYDPETLVCESRVVFGELVERHRRIAIETKLVHQAAREAGLVLAERFRGPRLYPRKFYVLRKP